ncbi:MAG: TonB-dependent receptor [Bacteroidetes bacterium]|nr:TonB-dependent receptor [Bacteroidota bacterium]
MKKILTLFSLVAGLFVAHAQNGEISGKVVDENGEGVPVANVVLVDNKGVSTGRGTNTDFDGNYSIKPLTPGKYNVQVSYLGYAAQIQQGVVVSSDKATFIDVKLRPSSKELNAVEIISYKVPLIDPGKTSSQNTVTADEIANMSTKNISDIAATTAGAFQNDQGGGINIKGGREDGTQYYIDGVKVTGVPTLPASSIEQLQVITGGVPAKYGDLTGGIVNITTKGPSGEFRGGLEFQTTQGLDAYGYNLVNANMTGPIWKQKSTHKTILGFFLAFEYLRQQEPDPSAVGIWQVKQNVLDSIRQYPLIKNPVNNAFALRADNLTYQDMYNTKTRPNVVENNFRGNGRFDLRPADNFTLSFGGSVSYEKAHNAIDQYTLLNFDNFPERSVLNWRVFGRFTHSIQSKQAEEDEKAGKKKKSSAFQNAFYSVQFDYEKLVAKTQDDSHGANLFNYGYIGKFDVLEAPSFVPGSNFQKGSDPILVGWLQKAYQDTAVLFTPGNLNPYATSYTRQYYELLDATVDGNGRYQLFGDNNANFTRTLRDIDGNKGLINGQRSSDFANNIWYTTGRQYPRFGYSYFDINDASNPQNGGGNNDQYHVRLEGAFDILKPGAPSRNKHSIEFGIEFEQRIQREYLAFPVGLWEGARNLANMQLAELDTFNPIIRIGGQDYTYAEFQSQHLTFHTYDTVRFERYYKGSEQSFFDKQLRKSLGIAENGIEKINIDALSPDQLNLNMFSPEELLNNGASYVSYRGYDPYGNVLSKQPSFNDFFTKKREDGELERAIPAFRPIYTAAYISDRFYFKDLTFNVGVRIDRFDANQKVLKDEYSLYPIKTTAEVTEINGIPISHPTNMGGDYAVYVDDVKSPTAITGYRHGDTWYDRYGNELSSGNTVATAAGIQPYLKDPEANVKLPEKFDPNGSFTDYKAKIIVMPRLQFSFNLTDRALFFAHYDILSQRPNSRVIMDPTQYLYFGANRMNNPNLKPERTIDFELGFKQRVSNTAAVTISAFYREFRDQIQLKKYYNAYPRTYTTYGNVDFGTTKGFALDFDMRRTANFTLKANYTMTFAEGTGSDDRSQLNIVNANQPNFRTISPLNYDSRHAINVNVSYSYGVGKDYNGPTVKNSQILADAGISLEFKARSGTPYTAAAFSSAEGLITGSTRAITTGDLNGSRKPWYFRMNMRVWKNFNFLVGKKDKKNDDKHAMSVEIYLQIQNLLNTKNVIGVYRYTGTANDNGYLSDPANTVAIESYLNPQAFRDQYSAYINSPNNYSVPRRIYLGLVVGF